MLQSVTLLHEPLPSSSSYQKMLERAGYTPDKHLGHISNIQEKEGADSMKLGAVSGRQYKEIFNARAFDQYFYQIPPKKRLVGTYCLHKSAALLLVQPANSDDMIRYSPRLFAL